MNEPDLSELMQEVKALRLIVYSLVEQNQVMRAEFNDFKQEIQSKSSLDSNSSWQIEAKQTLDSTSSRHIAPKQTIDSTSRPTIIVKQTLDSTSSRHIAPKQTIDSTSQPAIAPKQILDSNLSLTSGIKENQEIDTSRPISTDDTILPLPSKLSLSNSNIYPLASHLKMAGFGGGKESPVEAAAKLFLHFYNEEPGEYTHLRKLTGYSEGGLAKLLMRLRANGYLIKTGFQQHAITGKALYLMQQAGCK